MNNKLSQTIDRLAPSLADLFGRIGARTGDKTGISRDAYGSVETAAADILIEYARQHGLDAVFDRVGNVNFTAPTHSENDRELLIGSHIDSVPRGGNYDGLAGVIAGIGTLIALRDSGQTSHSCIRTLAFRGEESPWFGTAYLGSKLFTGQMTRAETETMRRFDTGKTLLEHLSEIGVVPADVDAGPVVPFDRIRAYLELHIEQGPLLEDLNKSVGIATAIRGNIRYPFAKCFGRYAHSAAVPRHLRHDALMATVKLIAFADEQWKAEIDAGHDDLVFTCGILQTNSAEHSMTKVPGEITFTLNIGSISDDVMERMHRNIADNADALAKEHQVRFDFGKRVGTGAVRLNADIANTFVRVAETVGTVPHSLPTVGHDAAMFARNGVPTGMILVRNVNGSHNPDEHMEMDDFIEGLKVLASSANEIVSRTNWCGADGK